MMTDTVIRRETGLLEVQCEHGIGHPLYASADWMARTVGAGSGSLEDDRQAWMVHGCDGCCGDQEWQLKSARRSAVIANGLILDHKAVIKELVDYSLEQAQEVTIGFTGTQLGMTEKQKNALSGLLSRLHGLDFHHGVCIGADDEAHWIAADKNYGIVCHPPINTTKMSTHILNEDYSETLSTKFDIVEIKDPKDYLDRNKDIVDDVDVLIAAPGERKEKLRSGTWSTVRYARKQNMKIYIIFPNGQIKEEN